MDVGVLDSDRSGVVGAHIVKRLWVGASVEAPEGWVWAKTYRAALRLLEKHDWEFDSVSLDDDLGDGKTGYHLIYLFEERFRQGKRIPMIGVHTANLEERQGMLDLTSYLNGALIKG